MFELHPRIMQLAESGLPSRVPAGQKMDSLSSKLFQQDQGAWQQDARGGTQLNLQGFQSLGEIKVKVAQSCLTLCNPMNYTVHEILQARILEWVAVLFSRGSSQPWDRTQDSGIAGRFFIIWTTREAHWEGYLGLIFVPLMAGSPSTHLLIGKHH